MLRVLVCDDAEPVRVTLRRALEFGAGAQVHAVGSAEEALIVLDDDRTIDVVVMDQDLPGMAGFDAVRVMRDEGIDIPVVLFTADRELRARAAHDPTVSYLCKADAPIAQVVSAVTRMARGGRAASGPE